MTHTPPKDESEEELPTDLDKLTMEFIGYAWMCFEDKNPHMAADRFKNILKQHELKADLTGRHAEVVKALFLIESLGPDYDVQAWLTKQLEDIKRQRSLLTKQEGES